jgi:hypothetical protein
MITGPPFAIPVTNPADVLDAIEESELLQATDDVMSFQKLSVAQHRFFMVGACSAGFKNDRMGYAVDGR